MTSGYMDSPIGGLRLVSNGDGLSEIAFDGVPSESDATDEIVDATRTQLEEYFAGDRVAFDVPLAPTGTKFQLDVWHALLEIPYGETVTYGEIATRLGLRLVASRAVGSANGSNPIPIIVPCHRVIGASGSLTGYGGGIERKRVLLELEQPGLF